MIKQKHVNVVLKLNCYKDVSLDEEDAANFSPERIAVMMKQRHVCIKLNYSVIVFKPDSTYMTLYPPDENHWELVTVLAGSEGLFVRSQRLKLVHKKRGCRRI